MKSDDGLKYPTKWLWWLRF